jgi:tetratricopeptide (TPR) repeat protein
VRGFAEQVADGVVDDSSAYRHAVASLEALKQLGFRYVKDPNGVAGKDSLDEIQFPRETLQSRVGDCDDLTVLYAATLEAMGIETAFIYVPGHILLAFDSQYPPGASHRLGKAAFEQNGKLWVPIEATAIPDGFLAARARGMKEVTRWKKAGKFTLQPVHDAWQTHPPMALPKNRVATQVDKEALASAAAKVMQALEAERSASMAVILKKYARKAKAKRASLESIHAYGLALVRAENYPAAHDVLSRAKVKAPDDHVVAINSMSLALLRGESIDLAAYAQAVEALDEAALYNNLGLAYFHSGDVEQAGQAFLAAAERGHTRLAESLGLMASERRAAGGKGEASVLERDLQSVMMNAFNRAKKNRSKTKPPARSRFTQALRTAGKRGTPPDVQRKLVDLLVWPSL